MPSRRSFALSALLPAFALLVSAPARSQATSGSVLDRTPNIGGAWLAAPGTIQFNFLHRFTESGPPQHQISNSPTFVVSGALPFRTAVGFAYATSSDVAPNMPNEWEFFGRAVPFRRGNPVADVALQGGYNLGAASMDAELALARSVGPLRLLAAGRTFSNAFDAGRNRTAVAGGTSLRLTRWVAVAGDAGSLLDRRAGERIAWSGSLQFGIPNAPHSMSIHATNANTGTLEGESRGTPRTRYGFEYTVPITLARYFPSMRGNASRGAATVAVAAAGTDTVHTGMKQLAYDDARIEIHAGTTVTWKNEAPLAHTVTADDSSFDSGLIDVGRSWSHTFLRPGTYTVHCTPHPFMTAVVVVLP